MYNTHTTIPVNKDILPRPENKLVELDDKIRHLSERIDRLASQVESTRRLARRQANDINSLSTTVRNNRQ